MNGPHANEGGLQEGAADSPCPATGGGLPEKVTLEPSHVAEEEQQGTRLSRAQRREGPGWRVLAEPGQPPGEAVEGGGRRPGHGGPPGVLGAGLCEVD